MANRRTNPYYHPEEGRRTAPARRSPYGGGAPMTPQQQRAAAARRQKAARARRRKRRLTFFAVVLLACGAVLFAVYHLLNGLVTGGAAALPSGLGTEDALKGDVVNILCAGIDFEEGREYPNGMGLTDVILYVTFDMKEKKISMLQIPRDTYVGGLSSTGKINAVALQGDTEPPIAALAQAIHDQFGLPVDYYITIDMDAFKAVIDAIGGIEVTVPFDIEAKDAQGNYYYNPDGSIVKLPAGTHRIDGATAEFMVRQRHNYGNADIGRLEMQRYMYSALLKTFKSFPLSDIIKVMPAYIQYVKTDINLAAMCSLAGKVIEVESADIVMFKLPGEPCSVNGQSVYTAHREASATILNSYFRPYSDPVPADQLGLIELQNTISSLDSGTGQTMDSIDSGAAQWGQGNVDPAGPAPAQPEPTPAP